MNPQLQLFKSLKKPRFILYKLLEKSFLKPALIVSFEKNVKSPGLMLFKPLENPFKNPQLLIFKSLEISFKKSKNNALQAIGKLLFKKIHGYSPESP